MSKPEYLMPPEEVDMEQAEKSIQRAVLISLIAVGIAVPLSYVLTPLVWDFPQDLLHRLVFAIRANVIILFSVAIAILMVSTGRRVSPEDIGGSAAGPPSDKIAIRVAFLQNTLEQAAIASALYLALATLVTGPWLSLIVIGVLFFIIGRILFFLGYAQGPSGRALGMTLTLMPTILGYLLVIVLMVIQGFS